ncbi:MAG: hypothetical protein IKO39_08610 [Treponema sp.]|nr:hypothetical protein [Treponema sp.]
MKKHNSKNLILSFALLGVFSSLFMSSCDGVIFSDIRKEVELADAKISGDIQSIIRYKYNNEEHIFVSNGEIYHRSVETSVVESKIDWQTFSNPTGFVYALAADSTNLYAASVVIEEDDDGYNVGKTRGLYCYKDGSWEEIWSASYSSSVKARLFCTNTPQSANREAYFRVGTDSSSNIWKLDGTKPLTTDLTDTDKNTPMTKGDTDNSTSPTTGVNSCTKLGSDTYFSTAEAMTSNETKDKESTLIYRCSGDNIYYKGSITTTTESDGTSTTTSSDYDWTPVNLDCSTIQSIAVTQNYILVGTSEGIAHQSWATKEENGPKTGGIPNSGNTSFSTNATSTLSSYYTIPALLVVDPGLDESTATIFASSITSSTSASLKNVGLWSYFATTGEWNRE